MKAPHGRAKVAVPAIPPEIASVAQSTLGGEAEAIAWGDLALTGHQQVLAINRVNTPGRQLRSGYGVDAAGDSGK